MMHDQLDPNGRPWRWGHPISRDEADAIARRYTEGHELTPLEKKRRVLAWMERELEAGDYNLLNDVRAYMMERGIESMETEVDQVLLDHSICEEECARQYAHLTGPELDAAFWACMDQCSPQRNQSYDLRDLPASPVEPEKLTGTTISLPGRKR